MSGDNSQKGLTRRQFLVRSAAGLAGATMSSYGFLWGDLAYGQQLKGKPVNFSAAIRPDWTQGWWGMINEEMGFWKKYLPKGSEVKFTHPIQGGIVTNQLIANKVQVGHNGDAPGLIATYKRPLEDIRIYGIVGSSPTGYHCYQIIVRSDAPEFSSSKEAVQWMNGKVLACPKGSCTDRFFQKVLAEEGVQPAAYLNQSIGVITSNLRDKNIDAAATWDPQGAVVSTLAGQGIARIVATGEPWGERDSGTMVVRRDFRDNNPEILKAWIKSEIETQLWYYDPRNHAKVIEIAKKYIKGFEDSALWFAMAGLIPEPYYGGAIRDTKPLVGSQEVQDLHKEVCRFLNEQKIVPQPEPLPNAWDYSLAQEAMDELGVSSPLVELPAVPREKGYPLYREGRTEEYVDLFMESGFKAQKLA